MRGNEPWTTTGTDHSEPEAQEEPGTDKPRPGGALCPAARGRPRSEGSASEGATATGGGRQPSTRTAALYPWPVRTWREIERLEFEEAVARLERKRAELAAQRSPTSGPNLEETVARLREKHQRAAERED